MHPALASEPLVFVDLETTGANFANDRIIEVGLVEVGADKVTEWSSLINPGRPVPSFITGLTGIDSAMVASAPTFEQLAPSLLEMLKGRLFIAHNARFDYSFLKREFKRLDVDFRATHLCTVKLSRRLFPEYHRHNLDALIDRFDIAVDGRHRALGDARALRDLWQRWHEALEPERIAAVVNTLCGRPDLPPQIDPALADDLPEAPGAYAMLDEDGAPLLVKRGANLRQQVLAHFSAARRDTPLARNTRRVEWRETAGELGARLRELELSAPLRRRPDDLCSWQLVKHGDDDFRPRLVFAHELDFAHTEDLFGLYANRREAVQALRKLADAHRLCHKHLGLGAGNGGEACAAWKQKNCRGVCVGREPVSLHSARLMMALAKFRLSPWPYAGPIALVERDEFGMREDFHVIDGWRVLGTAHDEATLQALLETRIVDTGTVFDPNAYRIVGKFLKAGKLPVLHLPLHSAARR